ncbi:MAG: ORF6N domain-containing protein [Chitinispirillales bacterium]|jgi:phage regulator Rha-like protein|nr:ORF6N domain-containing protein [Chitinispirillales bacterium]
MNKELAVSQTQIENRIFTIRGVQVMLDRDLAEMYGVETKRLNEQVKRNLERFPEEYRFQLIEKEMEELLAVCDRFGHLGVQNTASISRSQNATLNNERGQNIKYLPYAFTEQGVAMLSAVLRSEIAIQVSIQIINAFVQLRKIIQNNQLVYSRLDKIEQKQLETDHKFERVFKALEGNVIPTQGVFFEGQVFDAYELASKIIRSAKESIVLIDNWIDDVTITHLSKKRKGVKVLLLTNRTGRQLNLDVQKANEQYGGFVVKQFIHSHDRFLIIDNGKELYHIGASLKDLGRNWFAFSKMDKESVESVINKISGLM